MEKENHKWLLGTPYTLKQTKNVFLENQNIIFHQVDDGLVVLRVSIQNITSSTPFETNYLCLKHGIITVLSRTSKKIMDQKFHVL